MNDERGCERDVGSCVDHRVDLGGVGSRTAGELGFDGGK